MTVEKWSWYSTHVQKKSIPVGFTLLVLFVLINNYNFAVLLSEIYATLTDLFNKLLFAVQSPGNDQCPGNFYATNFVWLSVFITTYIT